MTKFVLPLAMAMSLALTCVSFAQTMAPPAGSMSNTTTSTDKMTKPDTMGKTDGMKKDEKADGMMKKDEKTDAMKKDGMAK
jgi:pentapeptide MXKDX repeat protein